jgi:hypothetical protein
MGAGIMAGSPETSVMKMVLRPFFAGLGDNFLDDLHLVDQLARAIWVVR